MASKGGAVSASLEGRSLEGLEGTLHRLSNVADSASRGCLDCRGSQEGEMTDFEAKFDGDLGSDLGSDDDGHDSGDSVQREHEDEDADDDDEEEELVRAALWAAASTAAAAAAAQGSSPTDRSAPTQCGLPARGGDAVAFHAAWDLERSLTTAISLGPLSARGEGPDSATGDPSTSRLLEQHADLSLRKPLLGSASTSASSARAPSTALGGSFLAPGSRPRSPLVVRLASSPQPGSAASQRESAAPPQGIAHDPFSEEAPQGHAGLDRGSGLPPFPTDLAALASPTHAAAAQVAAPVYPASAASPAFPTYPTPNSATSVERLLDKTTGEEPSPPRASGPALSAVAAAAAEVAAALLSREVNRPGSRSGGGGSGGGKRGGGGGGASAGRGARSPVGTRSPVRRGVRLGLGLSPIAPASVRRSVGSLEQVLERWHDEDDADGRSGGDVDKGPLGLRRGMTGSDDDDVDDDDDDGDDGDGDDGDGDDGDGYHRGGSGYERRGLQQPSASRLSVASESSPPKRPRWAEPPSEVTDATPHPTTATITTTATTATTATPPSTTTLGPWKLPQDAVVGGAAHRNDALGLSTPGAFPAAPITAVSGAAPVTAPRRAALSTASLPVAEAEAAEAETSERTTSPLGEEPTSRQLGPGLRLFGRPDDPQGALGRDGDGNPRSPLTHFSPMPSGRLGGGGAGAASLPALPLLGSGGRHHALPQRAPLPPLSATATTPTGPSLGSTRPALGQSFANGGSPSGGGGDASPGVSGGGSRGQSPLSSLSTLMPLTSIFRGPSVEAATLGRTISPLASLAAVASPKTTTAAAVAAAAGLMSPPYPSAVIDLSAAPPLAPPQFVRSAPITSLHAAPLVASVTEPRSVPAAYNDGGGGRSSDSGGGAGGGGGGGARSIERVVVGGEAGWDRAAAAAYRNIGALENDRERGALEAYEGETEAAPGHREEWRRRSDSGGSSDDDRSGGGDDDDDDVYDDGSADEDGEIGADSYYNDDDHDDRISHYDERFQVEGVEGFVGYGPSGPSGVGLPIRGGGRERGPRRQGGEVEFWDDDGSSDDDDDGSNDDDDDGSNDDDGDGSSDDDGDDVEKSGSPWTKGRRRGDARSGFSAGLAQEAHTEAARALSAYTHGARAGRGGRLGGFLKPDLADLGGDGQYVDDEDKADDPASWASFDRDASDPPPDPSWLPSNGSFANAAAAAARTNLSHARAASSGGEDLAGDDDDDDDDDKGRNVDDVEVEDGDLSYDEYGASLSSDNGRGGGILSGGGGFAEVMTLDGGVSNVRCVQSFGSEGQRSGSGGNMGNMGSGGRIGVGGGHPDGALRGGRECTTPVEGTTGDVEGPGGAVVLDRRDDDGLCDDIDADDDDDDAANAAAKAKAANANVSAHLTDRRLGREGREARAATATAAAGPGAAFGGGGGSNAPAAAGFAPTFASPSEPRPRSSRGKPPASAPWPLTPPGEAPSGAGFLPAEGFLLHAPPPPPKPSEVGGGSQAREVGGGLRLAQADGSPATVAAFYRTPSPAAKPAPPTHGKAPGTAETATERSRTTQHQRGWLVHGQER